MHITRTSVLNWLKKSEGKRKLVYAQNCSEFDRLKIETNVNDDNAVKTLKLLNNKQCLNSFFLGTSLHVHNSEETSFTKKTKDNQDQHKNGICRL